MAKRIELLDDGSAVLIDGDKRSPITSNSPELKRLDAFQRNRILRHLYRGNRSIMIPPISIRDRLAQMGRAAILPTAGSVIGGVVAPAFGQPPPVGQAVGGMGGEAINQLTGITPRSLQQVGLAGLGPAAGRPLSRLFPSVATTVSPRNIERIAQRVPGHQGAFIEAAREQIEDIPGLISRQTDQLLTPGESTRGLFTSAIADVTPIGMAETGRAARQIARKQALAARGGGGSARIKRVAEALAGLADEATETGGRETLEFLNVQRQELEGLLGATQNQSIKRQARTLLRGVFMDIDRAAQNGHRGAETLQRALMIKRREFAADDFQQLLDRRGMISPPRPIDGLREIRVGRLLDAVKRARSGRNPPRELELFAGSLPATELDEIERILSFWNDRISAAPPPKGVQMGSGRTLEAMSAGFILGPVAGIQSATGAAAFGMGKSMLSRVLMAPRGRTILRDAIQKGVPVNITEVAVQMILQGARSQLGTNPAGQLFQRFQAPQITNPR